MEKSSTNVTPQHFRSAAVQQRQGDVLRAAAGGGGGGQPARGGEGGGGRPGGLQLHLLSHHQCGRRHRRKDAVLATRAGNGRWNPRSCVICGFLFGKKTKLILDFDHAPWAFVLKLTTNLADCV